MQIRSQVVNEIEEVVGDQKPNQISVKNDEVQNKILGQQPISKSLNNGANDKMSNQEIDKFEDTNNANKDEQIEMMPQINLIDQNIEETSQKALLLSQDQSQ